jgi:plastocyanin
MKFFTHSTSFIIGSVLLSAPLYASAPVEIQIKSLSYAPKHIEIKTGQAVVWKNTGLTHHSATSNDEGKTFDTGLIPPGKTSKEVVFDQPGQYAYHCTLHGKTMSAEITVKGPTP